MELFIDTYDSPLGKMVLATDGIFVREISFHEYEGPSTPHPLLEKAKLQLSLYFQGKLQEFTLPTKQEGTEFQLKSWAALSKIPYGIVRSYEEQAEMLGNKKAVRAVGGANSRNNLSILVPCHRVIGKNNALTGYAGELWRKKWLLEHEQKYKK